MDEVPEIMFQPDAQIHLLKQRLKRDFKDEVEIEAFVQTSDLPVKIKEDILTSVSKIKQLKAENKQKLDDIGVKTGKVVEKEK